MAYESQFIKAWCSCDALESVGICETSTKWEQDCSYHLVSGHMFVLNVGGPEHWVLQPKSDTYVVVSHCSHSSWGVSGGFCHDYSILKCFPTYLLGNATVGRRALKDKHNSRGLAHTFIAEHGRPGLPIQNLNLVPSQAEQYGLKIK